MATTETFAPIALTMGEPGGIGGEVTVKAWKALKNSGIAFYVIADPDRLAHLGAPVSSISKAAEAAAIFENTLPVIHIGAPVISIPGKADPRYADLVLKSIENAVSHTLSGDASAVVTAPIQKSSLIESGFRFPGHTEFLADLTKTVPMPLLNGKERRRGSVMMIAGPELKTVPTTIHLPLKDAIKTLTPELITETVMITAEALIADFAIPAPRIALSGLNPHAGEEGALGTEEEEILRPAIAHLVKLGCDVKGPLPADAMFHKAAREKYDVAVCMYHDQALIPAKTLAFEEGVNTTLGLPIIRTSPDHGTALDIAGKDLAQPDSLIAAIKLAHEMAEKRRTLSTSTS